jgi:hypothetical protein
MQPYTLTRWKYEGKFRLRILEKINVGSENHSGSTTLKVDSITVPGTSHHGKII